MAHTNLSMYMCFGGYRLLRLLGKVTATMNVLEEAQENINTLYCDGSIEGYTTTM